MPIIVKNAWQQKSWWATMGLMGKRTKNLFLDMKKLVRKEVRSSSGTSIIDPLPLRALHKSLAQLPKIGILTILRQDWQFLPPYYYLPIIFPLTNSIVLSHLEQTNGFSPVTTIRLSNHHIAQFFECVIVYVNLQSVTLKYHVTVSVFNTAGHTKKFPNASLARM